MLLENCDSSFREDPPVRGHNIHNSRRRNMVQLLEGGAYLLNGTEIIPDTKDAPSVWESQLGSVPSKEEAENRPSPMEFWSRTIHLAIGTSGDQIR